MKLAVHLANMTLPGGPAALGPALAGAARAADQGSIETLTVMDHWFQMENLGGPNEPMLEGYSVLNFLAGQTERIQLGTLVTGVTYRHPGLLAKTVATLDVLSQGRALLGVGAAWYEREHHGLGVPYPSTAERFERLEETIEICRQMWSAAAGPYEGTHYRLAETLNNPPTLSQPGPPLMIGGSGEKKTLRLVARYADMCNLFATGVDEVRHKIDVLDGHCATEDRDPSTILRTIITATDPLTDTDAFLAEMERYAALGVGQVFVGPSSDDPAGWVESVVQQVKPRLDAI
ncbi:LLM class F420-dependent oxidoreductase [Williamsia herbipolensis]|uniref:LLM class F420-dependent oxidoreductase n=1 Tax=Williamsia herbipolensis TaxID=1603258 RepID=UPI0005F7C1B7|nr:LLM class F420-dependent oxidoreductase [Williamsia herbipolensis]